MFYPNYYNFSKFVLVNDMWTTFNCRAILYLSIPFPQLYLVSREYKMSFTTYTKINYNLIHKTRTGTCNYL